MSSSSPLFISFGICLVVLPLLVTTEPPLPVMDDRFYTDVTPGSRQYASLIKTTQKALNEHVISANSAKSENTPFRKIIRVVAVKTVKDVADAGFNQVRVIAAPTNCTVRQAGPSAAPGTRQSRLKCTPLQSTNPQDCKVSIEYNYFPHLNFNPGPKTNLHCVTAAKIKYRT